MRVGSVADSQVLLMLMIVSIQYNFLIFHQSKFLMVMHKRRHVINPIRKANILPYIAQQQEPIDFLLLTLEDGPKPFSTTNGKEQ